MPTSVFHRIRRAALAMALALTATFVAMSDRAIAGPSDPWVGVDWAAFQPAAIDRLVADGQVVFVDVTADWCATCQANKRDVLHRGTVAERLGADDVIPMKADWTRRNETVSRFVSSHGRFGVPLYVVYGPGAPEGLILPQRLSDDIVLQAVAQAMQAQ